MKFLLFLAIFTIFLTSCDENTTTKEYKCDPACDEWKICNVNRTCELKPGMCSTNEDCKDNTDGKIECSENHECMEPVVVACTSGDKRCNLNNVETCNTAGDAWEVTTECTNDTVCAQETFTCETPVVVTCTAGEKRCNTENIEICNTDGDAWVLDTDCVTDNKECKYDSGKYSCEDKVIPECIGLSFENIRPDERKNHYGDLLDSNYFLSVEFYEATPVGTYDLASTVNNNYETCEQCTLVYKINDNDETEKVFFQTQGNINITKGSAELGESVGEIQNIKLVEVTIGDQYVSTPVVDGECIEIETGSWDSMPTCEENTLRCNEDYSKIEKCTDGANNIWTEETVCDSYKECKLVEMAPSCELKSGACEPNTKKCNENNVEMCATDGFTWEISEACTLPDVCIEDTFVCESNIKSILEIKTAEIDLIDGETGKIYTTNGVVTAVSEHGFYMQDGLEAGIFVFLGYSQTPTEMIGDNLQVTGNIKNYGGLLEIVNTSLITISGVVEAPDFTNIDAANILDLDAQESMLVKLSNPPFTVLSVDSNHNIKLSDSNGNEFTVRNSLYTDFLDPMIDQKFIKLQGVLTYEYGEFKLLPRMESDIEKRPEIEDCTVNENQCNGNLINTLCDEVTLKCIEPIEIDICTEIGTECDNNTNSKTTCYNNECIELATKTILEIRTEEENLGENAIGSLYKTSGVVTAIKSNGFYLQDGVEAGIFVYTSDFTQVVGDKIDIIATAKNYNGWLELTDPIITSNGVDTLPEFTDVDALNILDLEAQESMMVNFLYPPFIVETVDGSGNVRLRDANNNKFKMRNSLYAFETPEINTVYTKLQGILTYEYAEYKLLPMSATDMIEKPEVVDCTIGGNECDVNTINTICDEMTLICIVPIEVEACNQNSDCAANTNGNIVCFNDVCVTPIEIDACTDGGDECLNNTNGKVLCVSDVCSLLPEVVDCTVGGNECDANFTNIVCNETTLKCEPLPTQPLNGDFENWVDDATPENWFGSKTSIASVNVTKSTEFQSGQFSISFLNETTDHKRFSSEATLWKAGTYSCTYFAKGTGDIRNSNTNVYGTYTNYTILVDADWTMITYDFTLDADVADFEFIFSLRNTDANGLKVDNLVCVPQ